MKFRKENPALVLGLFETGLGVGRSLGREGVRVIGLDFKKDIGFYSRYIDPIICPHPLDEREEFIQFLLKIGREEKHKPLLFVTSDDFLKAISRNREGLLQHFLFNLPDKDIIEAITDKFQQYELARKVGMSVPETYFPANISQVRGLREKISYPVLIKAHDVNSWRRYISSTVKGFMAVNERDLIDKFRMVFDNGSDAIVQEVINGPDNRHFKICCYISNKGRNLLSFTLQKIRQYPIRFGVGSVVQSVDYPELKEMGERFFASIGYSGVGSAEFKLDERDGRLKLIELNPRYWQQNALADKCGMNFPLVDYLEVTGQNPEPVSEYRNGVKWVNIYMDFNSFLAYRNESKLTLKDWLVSLKGKKVFSDFARDDIQPVFYEIRFGRRLRKLPQYIIKRARNGRE